MQTTSNSQHNLLIRFYCRNRKIPMTKARYFNFNFHQSNIGSVASVLLCCCRVCICCIVLFLMLPHQTPFWQILVMPRTHKTKQARCIIKTTKSKNNIKWKYSILMERNNAVKHTHTHTGNGFQEGWKNAGNLTIIENFKQKFYFSWAERVTDQVHS